MKLLKNILSLAVLLFFGLLQAQETPALPGEMLSFEEYLGYVKKYHPLAHTNKGMVVFCRLVHALAAIDDDGFAVAAHRGGITGDGTFGSSMLLDIVLNIFLFLLK